MTELLDEYVPVAPKIPWEWEGEVCGCINPVYGRIFPAPSDNTVCTRCNKIARWQLMTCTGCSDQYIFAFKHHARTVGIAMGKNHRVRDTSLDGWALDKGLCWNCICKKDPAVDGDIPPVYTESPRKARSLAEINLGEITFDL